MEYCEDQNGTINYIRAVQGHCHGARNNPALLSLEEISLNWQEHTCHTGSCSNCKSILESPRDSGRWIGLDQFMNQEWYWTTKAFAHIMLVIYYFNLRRAQDANLVFHKSSSDAIRKHAGKRTGQGCHFCRLSFVREELPTLTKLEVTSGDRIDLRISDQP